MNGFGDSLEGEYRLYAFIGRYGMINVILRYHPSWELNLSQISKFEGWIFGQEQPTGVTSVNSNAK